MPLVRKARGGGAKKGVVGEGGEGWEFGCGIAGVCGRDGESRVKGFMVEFFLGPTLPLAKGLVGRNVLRKIYVGCEVLGHCSSTHVWPLKILCKFFCELF